MTHKKPDPAKPDGEHRESQGVTVDQDFSKLLEASSLGSPAARRIRSLTPAHVADELRQKTNSIRQESDAACSVTPSQAPDKDNPASPAGVKITIPPLSLDLGSKRSDSQLSARVLLLGASSIKDISAFYESFEAEFRKALISLLDIAIFTPPSLPKSERQGFLADVRNSDIDLAVETTPAEDPKEVGLSIFESKNFKVEEPGDVGQASLYEAGDYSPTGLYISSSAETPDRLGDLLDLRVTSTAHADMRAHDNGQFTLVVVGRFRRGKSALLNALLHGTDEYAGECGFDPGVGPAQASLQPRVKGHVLLQALARRELLLRTALPDAAIGEHGHRRRQEMESSLPSPIAPIRQVVSLTRAKAQGKVPSRLTEPGIVFLGSCAQGIEQVGIEEFEAQPFIQWLITHDALNTGRELRVSLRWEWPPMIERQRREIPGGTGFPVQDPGLVLFTCTSDGRTSHSIAELFESGNRRTSRWLLFDTDGSSLDGSLPEYRPGHHDARSYDSGNSWQSPVVVRSLSRFTLASSGQLELPGSGRPPLPDCTEPDTPAEEHGYLGAQQPL
jgi:hypothetical protein